MEVMVTSFPCLLTSLTMCCQAEALIYNHTASPKIVLELPDKESLQFNDVLSHDCHTASDK